MGFSGGDPPPGQPSTERANWAIAGGTGAFLGARGQVEGTGTAGRIASMAEDPANRRLNGGNPSRYILYIIPMTVPQIVTTADGPAITHSSGLHSRELVQAGVSGRDIVPLCDRPRSASRRCLRPAVPCKPCCRSQLPGTGAGERQPCRGFGCCRISAINGRIPSQLPSPFGYCQGSRQCPGDCRVDRGSGGQYHDPVAGKSTMKGSLFIMSVFIAAVPISGSATWTPVNDGLPAQTLGIRAVVPSRRTACTRPLRQVFSRAPRETRNSATARIGGLRR